MDSSGLCILVEALGGNGSDGGDKGSIFPRSDAADVQKGARFIPFQVTDLRRAGDSVSFIQPCRNPCCWFWQLPDKSRIYHYESTNQHRLEKEHDGVCPVCNNTHFKGGIMPAKTAAKHQQKIPVTNTTTSENVRKAAESMFDGNSEVSLIINQEAVGQQELLTRDVLPVEMSEGLREQLESAGVVFSDIIPDDPIFCYATLPNGWKKEAMADSRFILLLDENGETRAQIFYKAALHDRRANLYSV